MADNEVKDTTPTPLSQQAATAPDDKPSWHGPVKAIEVRVEKLESGITRLEQKTDAQTLILSRIDGVVSSAWGNRYVRTISIGFALLVLAWLAKHGIKVEIPQ